MRTYFFIIRNPARVNFILRTDLFRMLKEREDRLVIVSPFSSDPAFVKEFGGASVVFETMVAPNRLAHTAAYWREQAFASVHPAIQFAREVHAGITKGFGQAQGTVWKIKSLIRAAALGVLPRSIRRSHALWNRIERFCTKASVARTLFDRYAPDAVFVATAGEEKSFLVECSARGIVSCNVDSNIDAPQLRYFSEPRPVTSWALFGEPVKKQMVAFHHVPESSLAVTGALRYDYLFREFQPSERAAFFEKLALDPRKKLVVYAAKISKMYPSNELVIKSILDAIASGELLNTQLFVRFDPGHDVSRYGTLLNEIVWEMADLASSRDHVANLLYHADAVTSIASTFNMEAMIFDTPSTWIAFDGNRSDGPTSKHYQLAVFDDLIKRTAILRSDSSSQLINQLKEAIDKPEKHSGARKQALLDYYHATDGNAGKRIIELIDGLFQKH